MDVPVVYDIESYEPPEINPKNNYLNSFSDKKIIQNNNYNLSIQNGLNYNNQILTNQSLMNNNLYSRYNGYNTIIPKNVALNNIPNNHFYLIKNGKYNNNTLLRKVHSNNQYINPNLNGLQKMLLPRYQTKHYQPELHRKNVNYYPLLIQNGNIQQNKIFVNNNSIYHSKFYNRKK